MNQFHKAIKDFTTCLELNNEFADAYYNRGVAKFRLMDYEGSVKDLSKSYENSKETKQFRKEGGKLTSEGIILIVLTIQDQVNY